MRTGCLAVMLVGLGAVACSPQRTAVGIGAAPSMVWPPPPEPARIQLVGRLPAAGGGVALRNPVAVAAAPDDRVFVVDAADSVVHVFDLAEKERRVLERGDGGRFQIPLGVAVDADGRAYVADVAAGAIVVFGPDERHERQIGGLARPTGLAVDRPRGILYCVETGAHQVRQMDLGGRLLRRLGSAGEGAGELSYPTFVAVDPDGRVLVSDSLNARVAMYEPDGRYLGAIGQRGTASGDLARPKGVAADSEGHVYVADALFGNIQVFDRAGALLLYFGELGDGPGQLTLPAGLAFDGHDRLFVANTLGGRVDVFQYLRRPPEASP